MSSKIYFLIYKVFHEIVFILCSNNLNGVRCNYDTNMSHIWTPNFWNYPGVFCSSIFKFKRSKKLHKPTVQDKQNNYINIVACNDQKERLSIS